MTGQLPPIAFFYHLREQALQDPWQAAGLLALYEIGLVLLSFGRKVWKKVWPELKKDAVNATAAWLLNAVRIGLSGFRRRYNQQVYYEHRFFNVRGLRTQGSFKLELDRVFVELRIAPAAGSVSSHSNLLADVELQGSKPIWDFLRVVRRKELETAPAFAVIGAPGCGKTTLLQHLALAFAQNRQRKLKLPAYMPVLLFLREHIKTIASKEPPHLAELVQTHFADAKRYPNLKPPEGWFAAQLRRGRCLVMLDGLDEVARQNQREKVSTWVNKQIGLYPRCPFILTSRPQGYYSAPLDKVHVLGVQPFSYEQVKRFVHAWYLENEIFSTGKDDPGVCQQAEQGAQDLLERLRGLPALSDLTVNPLLLTMIAMVHRYRGQLPGRRIELYAEICDVLLGHWRKAKGIQDNLTAAQKRVALQPLAAAMMKRRLRQIGATEAMAVMAEPLQSVNVKGEDAATFLPDVQASSGLLQESELGEWRFAHLSFQEYLAAAHFSEHGEELNFAEWVDDSWWHETLRLYAAQSNATALVRACLAKDTVPALSLAADCLDEARQIDIDVRQTLEQKLIVDLESDDPERRKLAAEVKLHRRLSS
ncbi:MAG: NACHT domain-containing protein [Candidatus Competibacter sp.]|nr:NACHT domain-containing protein [Candidatus Competibacter sp.]